VDKHELLRRISSFHLVSRDLAEALLAGDFASVFRGQGMEFDEVRRYERGDDVRSIDWNVTARFGEPYVKLYREERELSLCIVLDGSFSMHTGGTGASGGGRAALTRYEQALLASALLAFSAERSGQRVGALFFDAGITRVWSPRRGRAHIMAILNSALEGFPSRRGSGLAGALTGTARILSRRRFRRGAPRSLVAVISDFMASGWQKPLRDLAAHHDVIALRITSPLDKSPPPPGIVSLFDRETNGDVYFPPASRAFRESWVSWHEEFDRRWLEACRAAAASAVSLSSADDAAPHLIRYFRDLARRKRGGRRITGRGPPPGARE
jgi:uncharacterized protein (DUF58 family)